MSEEYSLFCWLQGTLDSAGYPYIALSWCAVIFVAAVDALALPVMFRQSWFWVIFFWSVWKPAPATWFVWIPGLKALWEPATIPPITGVAYGV